MRSIVSVKFLPKNRGCATCESHIYSHYFFSLLESEFDLLREENARLIAKITGFEFEKAELEARNAELIELPQ